MFTESFQNRALIQNHVVRKCWCSSLEFQHLSLKMNYNLKTNKDEEGEVKESKQHIRFFRVFNKPPSKAGDSPNVKQLSNAKKHRPENALCKGLLPPTGLQATILGSCTPQPQQLPHTMHCRRQG